MNTPAVEVTQAHVDYALRLAARYGAKVPSLADEFESAALVGLAEAAATYDPSFGTKFTGHAYRRIVGEIQDVAREAYPKGFRKKNQRLDPDRPVPAVVQSSQADDEWDDEGRFARSPLDDVPAGDPPVGWEVEYQDEVAGLSRLLPARARGVFRDYHGLTRSLSLGAAAAGASISPSWASFVMKDSHAILARRFKNPAEVFMSGEPAVNGAVVHEALHAPAPPCPACGGPLSVKRNRCYRCNPGGQSGPRRRESPAPSSPPTAVAPSPIPDRLPARAADRDPEVSAIVPILDALKGLDQAACRRVLAYVAARTGASQLAST